MKHRVWNALLVMALVGAQGVLWVGKGGLTDKHHMSEELIRKKHENENLQKKNTALEAEVRDLKGGMEAIEEIARYDLIMTRKGETYFQILDYDPE